MLGDLTLNVFDVDFKKDTSKPIVKQAEVPPKTTSITTKVPVTTLPKLNTVKPQKGGLSSLLGQLGKKSKISTLEKSKLDWQNFKQNEGISEEIETFNKGKDGYLERQDFLQRTDLRRFEIEKQLRAKSKRHT